MYQVSIVLGKSAGYDASILQVPIGTAVSAGSVALNIGESTGLTAGQIALRARECAGALIQDSRMGGGIAKAEMNPATGGKAAIVFTANNALSAETGIAAVRNSAGNLDGQTGLMHGALVQALEVFRETVLTGGLTIKP